VGYRNLHAGENELLEKARFSRQYQERKQTEYIERSHLMGKRRSLFVLFGTERQEGKPDRLRGGE